MYLRISRFRISIRVEKEELKKWRRREHSTTTVIFNFFFFFSRYIRANNSEDYNIHVHIYIHIVLYTYMYRYTHRAYIYRIIYSGFDRDYYSSFELVSERVKAVCERKGSLFFFFFFKEANDGELFMCRTRRDTTYIHPLCDYWEFVCSSSRESLLLVYLKEGWGEGEIRRGIVSCATREKGPPVIKVLIIKYISE